MKIVFTLSVCLLGIVAPFQASAMSDADKDKYLEVLRKGIDGEATIALAIDADGFWAWHSGATPFMAKSNALNHCKAHSKKRNTCKIVDVDGKSDFIKQRTSTQVIGNVSYGDDHKWCEVLGKYTSVANCKKAGGGSEAAKTLMWCATRHSVSRQYPATCNDRGGKVVNSKLEADAEHKRRAGKVDSASATPTTLEASSSTEKSSLPSCPASGFFHNCFGFHKFNYHSTYIGEWKNGKMHGRGIFSRSGEEYDGEWKANKMHGRGTYTWQSGVKYVGYFHENLVGGGTLIYGDGVKYVGEVSEPFLEYTARSEDPGELYIHSLTPRNGVKYLASGEVAGTYWNSKWCDRCKPTAEQLQIVSAIQAGQSSTTTKEAADIEFWQSIKDDDNPDLFQAYLDQFPDGAYVSIAKIKINELRRDGQSPDDSSLTERLKTLKQLFESELISSEDYEAKKAELLKEL